MKHGIDCENLVDVLELKEDEMCHPTLPHTLTRLPDHQRVNWLCPHCGIWNQERQNETDEG